MAPRGGAVPRRGDRVRRVSFLIDLGAGSRSDRAEVKLVVRRLLSHLAHQRPRLRDGAFGCTTRPSPHAFESRFTARGGARRASEPAPAPHDGVSRACARGWTRSCATPRACRAPDLATRSARCCPRAGEPSTRANPTPSPRSRRTTTKSRRSTTATTATSSTAAPPRAGDRPRRDRRRRVGRPRELVHTLARQMAAMAQAARELPTGEGTAARRRSTDSTSRSAARALDAHALGGHDLVPSSPSRRRRRRRRRRADPEPPTRRTRVRRVSGERSRRSRPRSISRASRRASAASRRR